MKAYREVRVLADHGAVQTRLCEDPETAEQVVVRTLSVAAAASQDEVDLFERESAVLRHIEHPRLPRILHAEREDRGNDICLHQVRAYVDGISLYDEVRDGRHLDANEALRTVLGIAETLSYLHGKSPAIVHRDIKPQNLIRMAAAPGEVSVIDLGAVKAGRVTGRTIVGTYGYMPPEQYEGQATPRSDVFALGMTLVFLLTHKEPGDFGEAGPRTRADEDFWRKANVDAPVVALVHKLIAFDPQQRPRDGAAAAGAIRAVLEPPPKAAAPAPRKAWLSRPPSKRRPQTTSSGEDGIAEKVDNAVTVFMVSFFVLFALGGWAYSAFGSIQKWFSDDAPVEAKPVQQVPEQKPVPKRNPSKGGTSTSPTGLLPHASLLRCTNRLLPRILQSEKRYASWVSEGGPTGKERHIYGLYTGYADAVQACADHPQLARYGARFLPLLEKVSRYYDEEDYRDDNFAYGRSVHQTLLERFAEARGHFESVSVVLAGAIDPRAAFSASGASGPGLRRAVTALHPLLVATSPSAPALTKIVTKLERELQAGLDATAPGVSETSALHRDLHRRLEQYRRRIKTHLRRLQSGKHAPEFGEMRVDVFRTLQELSALEARAASH